MSTCHDQRCHVCLARLLIGRRVGGDTPRVTSFVPDDGVAAGRVGRAVAVGAAIESTMGAFATALETQQQIIRQIVPPPSVFTGLQEMQTALAAQTGAVTKIVEATERIAAPFREMQAAALEFGRRMAAMRAWTVRSPALRRPPRPMSRRCAGARRGRTRRLVRRAPCRSPNPRSADDDVGSRARSGRLL